MVLSSVFAKKNGTNILLDAIHLPFIVGNFYYCRRKRPSFITLDNSVKDLVSVSQRDDMLEESREVNLYDLLINFSMYITVVTGATKEWVEKTAWKYRNNGDEQFRLVVFVHELTASDDNMVRLLHLDNCDVITTDEYENIEAQKQNTNQPVRAKKKKDSRRLEGLFGNLVFEDRIEATLALKDTVVDDNQVIISGLYPESVQDNYKKLQDVARKRFGDDDYSFACLDVDPHNVEMIRALKGQKVINFAQWRGGDKLTVTKWKKDHMCTEKLECDITKYPLETVFNFALSVHGYGTYYNTAEKLVEAFSSELFGTANGMPEQAMKDGAIESLARLKEKNPDDIAVALAHAIITGVITRSEVFLLFTAISAVGELFKGREEEAQNVVRLLKDEFVRKAREGKKETAED